MKIRNKLIPRTISDISACILLITGIPATYFLEIFIVFPSIYGSWTILHWFNTIIGTFLMFQVTTNLVAIMVVDTSIKNEILKVPDDKEKQKSWRFCVKCETLAPPRSWHCEICDACILKRDHHCIFAGCCVGHKNHRYFCVFLIYMLISTLYTTIHNFIYFYSSGQLFKLITIIKIICPLVMFAIDNSMSNLFIFLFDINILCLLFAIVMILYHSKLILNGQVSHEYEKQIKSSTKYNLGWKKNLLIVFGNKWYKTFISPFCESEQIMNGINWELWENKNKTK